MKVIIITGLSGAGKTQAIECLEDMGFYCIDNMPPALMNSFIELGGQGKGIEKAAFVIDVRSRDFFEDFQAAIDEMKKAEIDYKILYLEASNIVLQRRYNETRRAHPLAEGGTVMDGLRKERSILKGIREQADFVIDTSEFKASRLQQEISHILTSPENKRSFIVNIMSFGYKNGTPIAGDMVFDARFIPNPYYVPSLRKLTGNNKKVSNFVLKHEVAQEFLDRVSRLIEDLIPYYMNEGKYSLTVCFGCTGGHHRSVALANELNRRLSEAGTRTTLEHRDL